MRKEQRIKSMMKLKKVAAILLFSILIMQVNYSQSQSESKTRTQSKFKIELAKQVYNKTEVEKILLIVFEQTNKSIDASFAEGYKQGLLAASPDAQYYKTLSDELQKEVNRLTSATRVPWWTIPLSIAGGAALGLALSFVGK